MSRNNIHCVLLVVIVIIVPITRGIAPPACIKPPTIGWIFKGINSRSRMQPTPHLLVMESPFTKRQNPVSQKFLEKIMTVIAQVLTKSPIRKMLYLPLESARVGIISAEIIHPTK